MSRYHTNSVVGAFIITTALLITSSVTAKPDDYDIELVDAAHGKVKIHISNKNNKTDVKGAVIRADGSVGPRVQGNPTLTVPMRAVPTSIPGEYVFKVEPGIEVFDLDIEAAVPGETSKVTKQLHVNNPKGN
jgi:hypothetical protein